MCTAHPLILLILFTCVSAKLPDNIYDVPLDGEANHNLFWTLDFNKSTVKFEVHAAVDDNEWFAVGFSDRGDLEKADYCVYFPTAEGPKLMGIWTDDKCIAHEFKDHENLCGDFKYRADNILKFTFTRPFQMCTPHHYQIEDGTTHVVWARGSEPILGRSVCGRSEEGMTRVQILKTEGVAASHPPSTWVFKPHVKNVQVPSSDTTYWCHTFKLPSDFKRKLHVIQAEKFLTKGNEGIVHHMEFFHCELPQGGTIPQYSGICEDKPSPLRACSKVITAWAMGAPPFIYPKDAGLPVGGSNFSLYAMLEIHYNNPQKLAGFVDSSGFKVYLTPDLRPNDAGIIELGLEYVDKMAIPPKQRSFSLSGYCVTDCTSIALPDEGIMIFASQLHTHLTGVMTETRHIRDGVELQRLNYDYHYSPHFQEIRLLKKQRNVRPGDALIHTCYYNTMDRVNVTLGGFGTTDEMCVNYIYYYPKVDLEVCKSSISDDVLGDYFDSLANLEDQESGSTLPISESYNAIDWTPMRARILERLYAESTIFMQCNNSAGARYPGDWSHTPVTAVVEPRNRDANKCYDDVEEYESVGSGTQGVAVHHNEELNLSKSPVVANIHQHHSLSKRTDFFFGHVPN